MTLPKGLGGVLLASVALSINTRGLAQAPSLTVSPSVISNDYFGIISLGISNVAVGQTVVVERFNDLNGNGVVDSTDMLVERFNLTDGYQQVIGDVLNLNVPGDADGVADGQINSGNLYPRVNQTLDHITGQYIYRVTDPNGQFAPLTATLTIRNGAWNQGVTGVLTTAGSGTVLSNGVVIAVQDKGASYGATVDASGHYSLGLPPGNYSLVGFHGGMVGNGGAASLSIASNVWISQGCAAVTASNTIAGRVSDIATSAGLPGIFLTAEATDGLLSIAVTDGNGNYAMPAVVDQWKVKVDSESGLEEAGYVSVNGKIETNLVSGSISNINFQFPQANALVWGKVLDTSSNAVPGLSIQANDLSNTYQAKGMSRPGLGRYVIGVLGGSWSVGPNNDDLAAQGLLGQPVTVTVANSGSTKTNITVQRVTAHIRGRVTDNLGTPLPNAQLSINQVLTNGGLSMFNLYPQAQNDGSFDIGLFGGNWNIQIECSSAASFNVVSPNLQFSLTDNVDLNNVSVAGHQVSTHIDCSVVDSHGNPVSVQTYASYSPNGAYNACGNGTQINVFNGNWYVGISGDLTSLGYDNPANEQVTVNGNSPTATFVLYAYGQTPANLIQSGFSNGHFQFTVTGSPARTYRVEVNSNLANPSGWLPVVTNTPYGGSFPYVDFSPPGNTPRFYRAKLVQ